MTNQWFYIKRFKEQRPNWYVARMHKKTGEIYLIENKSGVRFKSSYYEASQFIKDISTNYDDCTYKIINEDDLDYIEQIFKKVDCDKFK